MWLQLKLTELLTGSTELKRNCKGNNELVLGSFHFLFFVLVDKFTKNENRLHDFLYDVFRLQGKTKMKTNNKKKNFYVIFLFFVTSSTKTKNKKWNEPNINVYLSGKPKGGNQIKQKVYKFELWLILIVRFWYLKWKLYYWAIFKFLSHD